MEKKARLGRGLGSLFGDANQNVSNKKEELNSKISTQDTAEPKSASALKESPKQVTPPQAPPVPPEARIWKIAIDKLHPNEFQPRQIFNKEALTDLANSIKEKGILQPIVARRHQTGALEIVSGERRWRAAQLAGLHEVPVVIRQVNDEESLELAIIENIQREDLNPIEEAEAYQRLIEEFKLTQAQVAEKVGKDRSTVTNLLRLLNLGREVRELLAESKITTGHAKALLAISNPKLQLSLAKKAADQKLTVRAIEKMAKSGEDSDEVIETPLDPRLRQVETLTLELQRALGTKVSIHYNSGKGNLSISFYSDDELTEMSDRLKEAWRR